MTEAITLAIEECLREGILEDILLTQRNEVMSMVLSTFDKELYERDLKEEAFEEGVSVGEYRKLKSQIEKKLKKGMSEEDIADILEESFDVIKQIADELKERNL